MTGTEKEIQERIIKASNDWWKEKQEKAKETLEKLTLTSLIIPAGIPTITQTDICCDTTLKCSNCIAKEDLQIVDISLVKGTITPGVNISRKLLSKEAISRKQIWQHKTLSGVKVYITDYYHDDVDDMDEGHSYVDLRVICTGDTSNGACGDWHNHKTLDNYEESALRKFFERDDKATKTKEFSMDLDTLKKYTEIFEGHPEIATPLEAAINNVQEDLKARSQVKIAVNQIWDCNIAFSGNILFKGYRLIEKLYMKDNIAYIDWVNYSGQYDGRRGTSEVKDMYLGGRIDSIYQPMCVMKDGKTYDVPYKPTTKIPEGIDLLMTGDPPMSYTGVDLVMRKGIGDELIESVNSSNACIKCKKESPYADAVIDFVCWSCKNGF